MTIHGDVEAPDGHEGEEAAPAFLHVGRADVRLVSAITSTLRVSRLHAMDNAAVVESLDELTEVLGSYLATHHKATLLIDQGRIYLNARLVRGGSAGWLEELVGILGRAGIGGLVFTGLWDVEAVRSVVTAYKDATGSPAERVRAIAEAARAIPAPAEVAVLDEAQAQAFAHEEEEGYLSESERAAFYYARLVALSEATQAAVREGRPPDVYARNVRQTLMKLTDFLRGEVFAIRLLGMTAQPPLADEPLASHAANTAVLCVGMGRVLGLSRGGLADLGFAAFYHDLGRAETGRRPDPEGAGEDGATFRGHVVSGVSYSLRARSYGSAGLLRIVVAQEHHRPADDHPDEVALREPHPYSRLVALADAFDKLEKGTPWRAPVSPARALSALREDAERHGAELVDLLEDLLGRVPRGTVVRLRDGATAVVVDGGAQRQNRPVVRRLFRGDGAPEPEGAYQELGQLGEVAAELDPAQVGFDWRRAVVG